MKKLSLGTILSLVIIFSLVTTVFAATDALPGTGWWSGETIQNVGTTTATLNIVAYDAATSNTYTISNETLAKGASKTYLPWNFPSLPANFQGSAVVSSSADVRAIVNVTNKYNAGQGVGDNLTPSPAAAQYQGVVTPAKTLYFPMAKNAWSNKTSNFAIQNADATAATATITLRMRACGDLSCSPTTYTYTTPSIGPGKMVLIAPADAGVPSGTIGSATVTSAANVSGTYLEFIPTETHSTVLQALRAFTSNDFSTTAYAPTVKYKYGSLVRNTGMNVQNVSGGAVNITVTYTGGAGTCSGTYTDSVTALPDQEAVTFAPGTVLPAGCMASAEVVATGNIVAVVSELYSPIPAGRYQESTIYNAFPSTSASLYISVPILKENSFGKATGLNIQNVSGSSASVIIKFIGPTGTYTTNVITLASKALLPLLNVRNQPGSFWNGTAMTPAALGCASPDTSTGCGANGIFAVVVISTQPVVAIANESTTGNWYLQDKNNYEGFNLTADPTAP